MHIPEFRRCRALTVSGRMCHQRAMRAEQFCVAHNQHRRPVCPPKGGKVDMPLLEDLSAIQLVASQVAHGLFTDTLDPWRAGKILYACQVAALTVPRPARLEAQPVKEDEPVTEVFRDLNGEILGPEQPWIGKGGSFEPSWSWEKYLYERECERLGKPKPQTPADMPPGGWLTPEEQAQRPEIGSSHWMLKILERRIEADRHYQLPKLEHRACYYDNPHCGGPIRKDPGHVVCQYCAWEREAHERFVRREKDPMPPTAREACAREGVRLTLFSADPVNEPGGAGDTEHSSGSGEPTRPLRQKDGSHGATAPSDTIDEPEKTEHLDRDKLTLLELRKMCDESCTLAPFVDRDCAYTMPDCQGPNSSNPCTYCRRERDNYRKLRYGDNTLDDLNASADPVAPTSKPCPPERRSQSDRSRRTRGCAKRVLRSRTEPALSERSKSNGVEATAVRPWNKKARAPRTSLLPQAVGAPVWAVHNGKRTLQKNKSRARQRASLLPQARGPRQACLLGWRMSAQVQSTAADPRPVVNSVNTSKPLIPRTLRNRQLYGGCPLAHHPWNEHRCGILSETNPYGISPGIPLRSLRNHHQPAQRLVDHPVRRRAAQRSAVEHRSGQRFRRAPLLRRIARPGVHQPLVRLDLHSAEAGLQRRPLRPRLKPQLSAPGRAWSRRRSCAGCPADWRRAARRAAWTPGIPASKPGARSAGWRGCPPM